MTVVAVINAKGTEPILEAIVRPGPAGVSIDGSDETIGFLTDLFVGAGDPPEPLSIADGDDWIQALPRNLRGTHYWAEFVSHGRHGEPLAPADLAHRLDLFEADLKRHGLKDNTVDTYVMHAKRMVRWLVDAPQHLHAGLDQAGADYAAYVRGRGLAPLTTQTYLNGPAVFIRWLQGSYVPGQSALRADAEPDEDDSWLGEQATQTRLVRWLKEAGWHIVGEAVGHQHGVDVTAEKGGQTLAIEVKGHPQDRLVAGAGKGEKRLFHPAAQARTYYANALHAALTTLHRQPETLHAIAFPSVQRYRDMVRNTEASLARLGVGVFLVGKDGQVETLLEARRPFDFWTDREA